jgi:NAD(P)-dependent dehydrogenase (short-subunit alcohol dehydrogenase family)
VDIVEPEGAEPFASFELIDLGEPEAMSEVRKLLGDEPLSGLIGVAGSRSRPELEAERDEYGWLDPEAFATVVADNLQVQYVAFKGSSDALLQGAAEWGQTSWTMVGSINAMSGFGGPAYSAGKAALHGLMVALTKSLGRLGVRINLVAPGTVDTRTRRENGDSPGTELWDTLSQTTALNKIAGPEDIARALVSVACDLTHMTGQSLVIDGGQLVVRD